MCTEYGLEDHMCLEIASGLTQIVDLLKTLCDLNLGEGVVNSGAGFSSIIFVGDNSYNNIKRLGTT